VDDKRFDAISRTLATSSLRRGMIKGTVGAVLGLVGLSTLNDGASAVGCSRDKDCGGKKVCGKRNICVRCERNKDCSNNKVCDNNDCVECKKDKHCSQGQHCNNKNKCVGQS
jgi:Cys-rich repeat protein